MNPIQHILHTHPLIVLDGALATELERYGCDLNDSLWSAKVLVEKPEAIKQVHKDYFAAGADCAITASYQTTIEGFAKRGINKEEAIRLMKLSAELAIEARDEFWQTNQTNTRPKPLVAGSVGPYGAYLADGSEYTGDYSLTEEELIGFHRPRIKALLEAGVDLLACETIPSLQEAKAIVRVLKEFPDAYAWVSFSAKDEEHISNGTVAAACAEWLSSHEQVVAVGINCTPPQYVKSLIKSMKAKTKTPLLVYPNSGEQYDPTSKTWGGVEAEQSYQCFASDWRQAGAQLIGGCCRTTPEDIESITKLTR
ncbi:homocysteine S-methyltransferase [Priestia flexa]|uniref:S-methylmethionine:homocysteine methyltransferase n=1 Tax=Priestia flexa TaxID=86664 RepID=A0A8I1MD49_9BACI|nr:homocysteine S-methyltransferase [Priestia flexa]MBN8251018.1 homocysteine S-methyltransferase [Priestia flexa]MBN8433236.1 homocysteine S-methyltransferase [Priestia flexa]MCA0965762.1 homocysteine S-methyltransferase [Priestia flexa]